MNNPVLSELSNALFIFIPSCAIIAISSANLSICILTPFTLISVQYPLHSFIGCSMYTLNDNDDKLQPCLTPFLIAAYLYFLLFL